MARGFFSCQNSAPISTGASSDKVILAYIAPSTGAAVQRNSIGADFGGTDSTAAAMRVDLILGGTGGSGSASVTPVATRSSNPTGAAAGTGAEAYSAGSGPTGGTIIGTWYPKPYGQWRVPAGREIVLNGSQMLQLKVTPAAAANIVAFMSDIET